MSCRYIPTAHLPTHPSARTDGHTGIYYACVSYSSNPTPRVHRQSCRVGSACIQTRACPILLLTLHSSLPTFDSSVSTLHSSLSTLRSFLYSTTSLWGSGLTSSAQPNLTTTPLHQYALLTIPSSQAAEPCYPLFQQTNPTDQKKIAQPRSYPTHSLTDFTDPQISQRREVRV